MTQDHFRDLVANGERGVERRHRLLEDHRDPVAAQFAHRGVRQRAQVRAFEQDFTGGDAARRLRHQSHDRQRRHALAAAGLADDAQRAARLQAEANAIDGSELAALDREARRKIADFEQRSHDNLLPRSA